MKNILWTSSAGSAAVLLGGLIMTQGIAQEKSARPSLVITETNVGKATVEDINHAKREVTLKDQQGDKLKMKVGDEVQNLDKVKKGDEVVAGFYQSAAITVNKPGETPS